MVSASASDFHPTFTVTMQFVDLQAQYQRLKSEIDTGIQRVLAHGQFILGPEVAQLEERLAAYTGAKHCITVANGKIGRAHV